MKVDINESAEKKFEPFSFTVTVETPEEARLWFHVFNRCHIKDAIFINYGSNYLRDTENTLSEGLQADALRSFIKSRVDL